MITWPGLARLSRILTFLSVIARLPLFASPQSLARIASRKSEGPTLAAILSLALSTTCIIRRSLATLMQASA